MQEHVGSEKSCVWHATDFSDGELKDEMFCIRFGSIESEHHLPSADNDKILIRSFPLDCEEAMEFEFLPTYPYLLNTKMGNSNGLSRSQGVHFLYSLLFASVCHKYSITYMIMKCIEFSVYIHILIQCLQTAKS